MIPPPILDNDDDRVVSLVKMKILDTPREADFDRIVRDTQRYFKADIVLITLVDKDRQWFKARCGLDTQETSREISFCAHAIAHDEVFVVENAKIDARFCDNPLVTGAPNIEFYAGQPLKNAEGYKVGTLCILSSTARKFSADDKFMIEDLGRITEQLLENRRLGEAQKDLLDSLASNERGRLIDTLSGLWNRNGFASLFSREVRRATRKKESFAVGIVDIDQFKGIAGRLGAKARDDAIKLTAELLIENSRAGDSVTRRADGRFQLIASDVDPAFIAGLGRKILKVFRASAKLTTAEGTCGFTISIGIAVSPTEGNSHTLSEDVLKTAEAALLKAKLAGGDRFEIAHSPPLSEQDFPVPSQQRPSHPPLSP